MPTLEKSPADQLATPIQFLKGVGPQRADLLQRLDLHSARDVLFFFPRDYQDMTDLRDVPQLEEDKLQSVCGVVEDVELRGSQPGKCVLGVLIRSASGHIRGLWFNQPFMEEKFKLGQRVMFAGKPKLQGLVWQMSHPKVDWLGEDGEAPKGRILPVYPLTEGLPQWQMRKIVGEAVASYGHLLEEIFPDEYLQAHNLWPLHRAIEQIHSPASDRATGGGPTAAGLSGALPLGAGPGHAAASAARSAAGPCAGINCYDRRADPPPLSLRIDREPAAGDRRNQR